jgi:hypothetical protein
MHTSLSVSLNPVKYLEPPPMTAMAKSFGSLRTQKRNQTQSLLSRLTTSSVPTRMCVFGCMFCQTLNPKSSVFVIEEKCTWWWLWSSKSWRIGYNMCYPEVGINSKWTRPYFVLKAHSMRSFTQPSFRGDCRHVKGRGRHGGLHVK